MRIMNAQLRYYFHIDPEALTDEEWADRYCELKYIREEEMKRQRAMLGVE